MELRKLLLSLLIFLLTTPIVEAADLAGKAELQNLRYSLGSGMVRIVLDINKKVDFVESYAENPSRLVLSLKNSWIDVKKMKRDIALNSTAARHIKVAQFDPSTVRVVVETMADVKIFWLDGGPSGNRLVVDVGNATFKENPELNKPTPEVKPPSKSDDEKVPDDEENPDDEEYNQPFERENQTVEQRAKELDKRERELDKREKELRERELKEQERQKERELKEKKERAKKEQERKDKKSKDTKAKDDGKNRTPDDIDKDLNDITRLEGRKIVIDPGHGGNDSGAIGPTGVTEKSVTLRVSLRLAELLRDEGAEVILTRETDRTVSSAGAKASDIEELQARCAVANRAKADIFVSIHADSFTNPNSRGTTGYYYAQSEGNASRRLADAIRRALCDQIGTPSRGTKPCNFYVVRHTDMPATLIELAFISNPEEEAILDSAEGIESAAQGILDGIEDYFG